MTTADRRTGRRHAKTRYRTARRTRRWPRRLTPAEVDIWGRGFNEGWRQGFACGRDNAR